MALSLRERQIAAIKRLLQLNAPTTDPNARDDSNEPTNTADDTLVWKVLCLDNDARDVVSTVLRVNDLRAAGVTVHFKVTSPWIPWELPLRSAQLERTTSTSPLHRDSADFPHVNSKRHPIPDTPCIYLLQPTADNLELVNRDLTNATYSPAYLNFLSPITRPLLESFGSQVAASGTAEHIASLHDQYLNFVVSDADQFHLNLPGAYYKLNSSKTQDQELDELINQIVSGLFSTIVTMGVVPIIRCQKGGAAEDISAKLDRKLRDHVLNNKDSDLFDKTVTRPVLIVVDRNLDLCPLFSHSWIYQSLVYDCLGMSLNKVTLVTPLDTEQPEKGNKKTIYDITGSDSFWKANAAEPFPSVAENVTEAWSRYQQDAENVTKRTGSNSIEDLNSESNQFAAHLKGAISLLPELRERKTTLESHMSILEAVMDGIKQRKLDEFFQLEEELSKLSSSQVLDIITATDKGADPMDKVRLFLQWYLTTGDEFSRADLERFTQALNAAGADTTAIRYVATVRQVTRMARLTSAPTQQATPNTGQLFGGFGSSLGARLKDVGLGANLGAIESALKGYLPKNSDLTLTKVVESLVDPQNASASAISQTEGYLYFDPKSANARGTLPPASRERSQQSTVGRGIDATFGQKRQGFAEAIVFPVGGGSMDEYGNLQEWAKRTSAAGTGQKRRIVYGSTALYAPTDFINNELVPLGKEST